MSQLEKKLANSVEKTANQTPAVKNTPLECPPAPFKRSRVTKLEAPQKPSLTRKEARQLRTSWKGLIEMVADPCGTNQRFSSQTGQFREHSQRIRAICMGI